MNFIQLLMLGRCCCCFPHENFLAKKKNQTHHRCYFSHISLKHPTLLSSNLFRFESKSFTLREIKGDKVDKEIEINLNFIGATNLWDYSKSIE